MLKAGGNYFYDNKIAEITLGGKLLIWFEETDRGFKALNISLFHQNQQIYFSVENTLGKFQKMSKVLIVHQMAGHYMLFLKTEILLKFLFERSQIQWLWLDSPVNSLQII